jgi:hypothetical protein
MRKLAAGAVLVAVVGAAVALLVWRQRAPDDAEGGRLRRWAVTLEAELQSPGQPEPTRVRLSGEWVEAVSATRPGEQDLACRLEQVEVAGGRGPEPSPASVAALRARLETPFWITRRADGAVLLTHFPRSLGPTDRNLLQLLAGELELIAAPPGASDWTAEEQDGAGRYLAAYHLAGPGKVEKTRLRYLPEPRGQRAGGLLAVELVASRTSATFDSAGGLATLDGSTRLRLGDPTGQERLEVMVSVRLSAPRVGREPSAAGSLERARAGLDSGPMRSLPPDLSAARARRDEALLSGRSTADLLVAAASADADRELGPRLAALFRARPESIASAVAAVRDGQGVRALLRGLGAAGTPATAAALAALAADQALSTALRISALGALHLVDRPEAPLLEAARRLLESPTPEVRNAAGLLAGHLVRVARERLPDEAAGLEADLLLRTRASRAPAERVAWLGALGNDGGPAATAEVLVALASSESTVRAAAARALRFAPPGEVDARLASVLASEPEPRVRQAALFAAGFRDLEPLLPAIQRAATADAAEAVRAAAVSLLRGQRGRAPGVKATLEEVARRDPRPAVRRRAQEALDAPLLSAPSSGGTTDDPTE